MRIQRTKFKFKCMCILVLAVVVPLLTLLGSGEVTEHLPDGPVTRPIVQAQGFVWSILIKPVQNGVEEPAVDGD